MDLVKKYIGQLSGEGAKLLATSSFYRFVGKHLDSPNLESILQSICKNVSKLEEFGVCWFVPSLNVGIVFKFWKQMDPNSEELPGVVLDTKIDDELIEVYKDILPGFFVVGFEPISDNLKSKIKFNCEWFNPSPLAKHNRDILHEHNLSNCPIFPAVYRHIYGEDPKTAPSIENAIGENGERVGENGERVGENSERVGENAEDRAHKVQQKPLEYQPFFDGLKRNPGKYAGKYYLFTDGGAIKNGRPGCRASYGWELFFVDNSGNVQYIEGGQGEILKNPTNNRGELTAILKGLEFAHEKGPIVVVSDSQYCLNSIFEWSKKWISKGEEKANMDLIRKILKFTKNATPKHVRSHQKRPTESWDIFLWWGNSRVDERCNRVLSSSL